jgi:hypothetical protein
MSPLSVEPRAQLKAAAISSLAVSYRRLATQAAQGVDLQSNAVA